MTAREQLNGYIEQLERRLRLGVLSRGVAVVTATALATTFVLVLIANALRFSTVSVAGARTILFLLIACAIGFALAIPLMRLNRRHAAAKAEQAFPEFQERLVTLAGETPTENRPFEELLASDTLKIAQKTEASQLVSNNRLLTLLGVGLASLAVLLWMILAAPGYLGYGSALLWAGDTKTPMYEMRVTPGNATVRRNADLLITAEPHGIQPDKVRIYARYDSASKWEQLPMQPQAGASGFQFLFAGLPEGVEYYVEAGSLHSRHFNIKVVDLPSVKQIRVTYRFPAWTGMSASTVAGGDLRAVEGTQAELEVTTDRPLTNGVLVLDDDKQLQLSGGSGNVYRGAVDMQKDGAYHLAAVDGGQEVRLSEDFFIEADKAAPPEVAIARPGGDYRASPIEEVTVSAKADDPFGLDEFSLHYAVNGGPEQSINLLKQKGAKSQDGATTLSLENFKVVPGDIVSLYATAKDAHAESRTDMFFIQAEPFEREFSQSQQSGGGGGGAGGNAPDEISQREKEIIAATWKQSGDKDAAVEKAAESAKFLSGVQAKLRDQALSLAGRLQMRDLTGQNEEFTDFQKDMNAAADAMGPASGKLQAEQWKDALPQEQKALQHLLRAEATFRQIQVAFGSAGGGAGSSGSAGRDLASLFDLELDTQKNQYEVGQTADSAAQRAKDIDDALRKLDELARRQDELASQQRNGQTSDQRWQQEMLRRQAEELQRQIEQMSRNGQQGAGASGQQGQSQGAQGSQDAQGSQGSQSSSDARVQQALNQLRQANDDMRRAASQPQSQADARRAAERLKEATNLLGGAQQQQSSARLDGMANEADRLASEHRSQTERMLKMSEDQYKTGADGNYSNDVAGQQSKLAEDRQKLADDLSRMEKDMRDTVRDLSSSDRAAASKLRDAVRQLDQSDLDTRLQRSADSIRRGVNPNYNGTEPQIDAGLQQLSQQVHEAQKALGSGGSPQNSQDAIDQVERLRDRLQSLDRNFGGAANQTADNGANRSSSNGPSNGQGANGPQGNPGASIGQFADGGNRQGYGNGGPYYGGMNSGNNGRLPQPVPPDTSPLPPEAAYRDSLSDLDKLRQSVQDDPEMARQVQKLIEEMQRLDPSRFPGNPALVEQLHGQVLADVDKLELQLRRGADGDHPGEIRSDDSLPVPVGYQDAVAEYFRRLSKNP